MTTYNHHRLFYMTGWGPPEVYLHTLAAERRERIAWVFLAVVALALIMGEIVGVLP